MITSIHAPTPIDWANGRKKIFLAGSIDNGTAVDWQADFTHLLQVANLDFDVLNPRRKQWDSSWKTTTDNPLFVEQVSWELEGLERADYKIFYFAPNTLAPITLLELGLYGRQDYSIVCCPKDYWRKGNVDMVCQRYGIRQVIDIQALAQVFIDEQAS